ncbi:MAG: hypothetical protein QF890_17605 [Myxococcota bacterium]|jgi:hypothetical protein|nr:hypothetical protein [bacterium]MDP7300793.1 hypothetical protein [Myxococcota bacterium]MDP7434376.1 hypothetical protein [Myxococcota bacterium]|tara:strand:- start:449 stop:610 length:162 start_codon:yes stop_codon:yes gene_type:complete
MVPEDTFRAVCGDAQVVSALLDLPNFEVEYLGEMRLRDRARFTYRGTARRAAE